MCLKKLVYSNLVLKIVVYIEKLLSCIVHAQTKKNQNFKLLKKWYFVTTLATRVIIICIQDFPCLDIRWYIQDGTHCDLSEETGLYFCALDARMR